MNKINPHKAGIALGAFAGVWHLVWSTLVAFGVAQPVLNWILGLHMVESVSYVSAFSLGTAIMLIVVTSIIGYIGGWVLGTIWNWALRS